MRNSLTATRVASTSGDPLQRRFYTAALIAMLADLASKAIAVRALGEHGTIPLFERLTLMVVWNTGGAGGVSFGAFTAQLNVLMTVLAVLLVVSVVRPIAAIDPRAAVSLGLVTGGALGNLASILFGHPGVADFVGMHLWNDLTIVANVADFMLWGGALSLAPVAGRLIRLVRAERRAAPALPQTAV